MNLKKVWIIPLALLVLATQACNYPVISTPTPITFPTPDLTLTAVFNPTEIIIPTEIVIPTLTPFPTYTSPPPTIPPTIPPPPTATQPPPTPKPSNTPVPTVSYAGPQSRPKYSVSAYYFSSPPKIDGVLEEWTLDKILAESIVYGSKNWSGINDCSGRVMFGWDNAYFYVGVRVLDDIYAQSAHGEYLYEGDSLELLFDIDVPGDYYLTVLDWDDFQVGISPGSPNPGENREAYLWFPTKLQGSRSDIKIGAKSRDDGYIVEAAIPWTLFGLIPTNGQHFGFAFSVSDNDVKGDEIQQSMVSNVPTRVLTNPTTWGDLLLVK